MNFENLVFLPLPTLAIIATGYVAYRIAYADRDAQHKATDVILICAVFGFIARFVLDLLMREGLSVYVSSLFTFIITLLAAGLWRRCLSQLCFKALRNLKISHNDGLPTAWHKLISHAELSMKTLHVMKKNGAEVISDLGEHNNKPHGACYLGSDGSISLYIDSVREASSRDWEDSAPQDCDGDPVITYLPKEEIMWVKFTYSQPTSHLKNGEKHP